MTEDNDPTSRILTLQHDLDAARVIIMHLRAEIERVKRLLDDQARGHDVHTHRGQTQMTGR